MYNASVLLWRAQIAGVLERDPGVPGFKQHAEHLAPEVLCLDAFKQFDVAAIGTFFVFSVRGLECGSVQVMQVGHIIG